MAKLTRLATTVTARFYPAPDLTDAFYLDGRLSGKREGRSADITIDREERGFIFSVFSHSTPPGRDPAAEPAYEAPLRKMYNEIKTGRKSLDDTIGELVNTAVAVTGRMKLQAGNVRTPFFAGIIVKDSEAFAITMGKGLAFLYRDDTLFPLTSTDIRIDPVNTQHQKVENFFNYCAAKTATALCSNIAQLKMDDCLIICNREVYEALGQQEILRILYDSEDQCDAAGAVVTEAAAKLPGVPMQFMISFVEAVTSQERGGLFGFGKKNRQQSYNEEEEEAIEVPIAKSSAVVPPPVSAPYADPSAAAATTSEPLYFGSEATNPFIQPLAETPVVPAGPDDPIHFEDSETPAPFGAPTGTTEPSFDEGGFVIPAPEDIPTAYKSAQETEEPVNPAVPERREEGYSDASFFTESSPVQSPQYIPDEGDDTSEALFFGDDAPSSASAAPASQAEASQGAPGSASYFIPFESDETTTPESSHVDDIPDMPLYEAPSYTPPVYPNTQDFGGSGVYARGSYSMDADDSDVRKDYPQRAPAGKSYSYTPPPQTVPSYGETRDRRAQGQQSAQGGYPQNSAGGYARDPYAGQNQNSYGANARQAGQPPRPRANDPYAQQDAYAQQGQKRYSQDMFDQDSGYEYGEPDAAYRKNRNWVIALIAVCVICLIVLIASVITRNNGGTKATTAPSSSTAASAVVSDPSAASVPSESVAASDVSVTPGVSDQTTAPIETTAAITYLTQTPGGQFIFNDSVGFRTWWDVMYKSYQLEISSDSDSRIAYIKAYNMLAADYVPKSGDVIYLPKIETLPTVTPTTTP